MNNKFLMNPHTGSVDTEANWKADMASWETTQDGESPQQQFDELVEVQLADDGGWVEVD